MPTIPVLQFNGGMTSDARNSASFAQLCKHFDNFTSKHRLNPYRGGDVATVSPVQTTSKIERMLMYNSVMYGYGVTAGGFVQIFSSASLPTPNFGIVTTGADSAGTPIFDMFVEYKGVLYGGTAGNRIWSYTIATNAFVQTSPGSSGLTHTSLSNGVVHSKDDILYFGVNNSAGPSAKIYYKNGSGDITLGLALPSNLIISGICEYGNYLAIACRPLYQDSGNSKVFLWDRDSTLTTLSESIDWGNNDLFAIENIDGYLIGVAIKRATTLLNKLIFSKYSGGGAVKFNEVPLSTYYSTASFLNYVIRGQQKFNNRLYFGLSATSLDNGGMNTGDYTGIWSVGRSDETAPFAVQFDRTPNNDTSALRVNGFLLVNDFAYISYQSDATTWALSFTSYQNTYNATAIYRTVINPNMPDGDKIKNKTMVSVGLTCEPIISGFQCVLKYKVNQGTFTTLFIETGTGVFFTKFPVSDEGVDIEFQIESKGVVVTSFFYEYQVKTT